MRTLIAVPCTQQVAAGFAYSLAMLKKTDEWALTLMEGSLVYDSRNKLVQAAQKIDADRILWIDSDMTFPPDIMEKLESTIRDYGADIVTAVCYRRTPPYTPVLFNECYRDEYTVEHKELVNYPEDKPFEIAACGCGCMLMKTDFLTDMFLQHGLWFDPMLNASEDVAFCVRAREMGKKIMCNPAAQCGHVGTVIINKQFFDAVKKGRQK